AGESWLLAGEAAFRGLRGLGDRGQGLVEYALLLMFVGLVLAGALLLFGQNVGNLFQPVIAAL
ncbi:MAG: hypothetical protein AABZ64_04435, partial [Nitrospinota bacterium]